MSTDDAANVDPIAFWRALRSYLKVVMDVENGEQADPRSPVKVRITATNEAPSGLDHPEIVFAGVNLSFGSVRSVRPSKITPRRIGANPEGPRPSNPGGALTSYEGGIKPADAVLAPGESLVWELTCSLEETLDLQPDIDAYVYEPWFFRTPQAPAVPPSISRPLVLRYVRAFGQLGLVAVLTPRLTEVAAPTPTTTFEAVQRLISALSDSGTAIDDVLARIQTLYREFAHGPEAVAHATQAAKYLREERNVRDALRDAISSANSDRIAAAVGLARSLAEQAAGLDHLAGALLEHYGIAPAEAPGLYVTRQ